MIKFYKTIIPMAAILNLVTSMVLILSLIGRLNASSLYGLIEDRIITEPFTLILLGIGLIGIAGISRKKFKLIN